MKRGYLPLLLVLFQLFSCSQKLIYTAPPIIVSQMIVDNSPSDEYTIAELRFSLQNKSEATINGIHFSFDLFDSQKNPQPRTGGNHFDFYQEMTLAPGFENEISLSLDELFFYLPSSPLTLSRFHIKQVNFGDGSVWEDPLQLYLIPDEQVEVLDNEPSDS